MSQIDKEITELITSEEKRQTDGLEMIPSENHSSKAVRAASGSILTDKYSEGYPGMRYYAGCEFVDQVENIARDRAKKLFGVSHANVQPHSGSPANQAIYFALVDPGDTVMGMSLYFGGHMTHGLKVNFSGTYYHSVQYTTDKDGFLDYDAIYALAQEHKPKLIMCGTTAYPRKIDWQKFREIADAVGAWLVADISHISGLVVSGDHPSPVGIVDVIMTTTHKTLRGPRGAMILCNGDESNPLKAVERTKNNIPTLIDRAVIPGLQGGPHNHQTAAIAVALGEALTPAFKEYGHQIALNAKTLSEELIARGFTLVTGGTDNHLMVVDLSNKDVSGKEGERALSLAGITVNKNTVPFDPRKPFDPSGIRLGTPALTTRGMKEKEMKQVAVWIEDAIKHASDEAYLKQLHEQITTFARTFPLPS
ncbi:MAG TPA: serine hydroxymethyltransferase [Candidatus Saccharibacteria bacterium]|jgi:glycine hydroxymethyltransferase|nr:serine hydroxymethyltransferase [Candidatus Saccharibacteria bacterium]HMT55832.1 serine hydroxymethyltransferase [Candidatus Saccharibacteria bacterium]